MSKKVIANSGAFAVGIKALIAALPLCMSVRVRVANYFEVTWEFSVEFFSNNFLLETIVEPFYWSNQILTDMTCPREGVQ